MNNVQTVISLYKVPKEVLEDISNYRAELGRFLNGEISADRFKPFRVTRGIYSQRGQTSFMMRIKVPAGGLLPEQIVRISELSSRYANGIPHVTTRQDVQLHWVKIEDTVKVMEGLAEVGLTTKGGGGNTIRNITACADSGVCGEEAFDVAPYAIALTEYFLTHPRAHTLPRKYKIAFSGCGDDCSLATVNDVGFIATKNNVDGKEREGFRVYVGGGMGAWSRVGTLFEEFIPAGDAVYVAEAVLKVFDKHGNRRNKHKARLRFLVERLGLDEFKRLYKEELKRLKDEGPKDISIRPVPLLRDIDGTKEAGGGGSPAFNGWFDANVREQRQSGFYYVKIKLHLGDITAEKFGALAEAVKDLGEGTVRTTHDQNIIIRWLRKDELQTLYGRLEEIGLKEAVNEVAGGVDDVISCPGASTCNLGICLSKNLATELSKELRKSGLPLSDIKDAGIKVSGCPNSCSQHPVGAIGFFGAARTKDGRTAPYYNVLVGGRVKEGETRLGKDCGFVPARSVPATVKEFLGVFTENRLPEEGFHTFLDRRGYEDMKRIVEGKCSMPAYDEDRTFYRDWNAKEDFSLAGLGPGECGAGVFDMIETDMDDARKHLNNAREGLKTKTGNPSEDLYKALVNASRALLITQGIEPTTEPEALRAFEKHFVKKGLVPDEYKPERFRGLETRGELFRSGHLNEEGLEEGYGLVEELLAAVTWLYDSMDDTMSFTVIEEKKEGPEEKAEAPDGGIGADVFMDLRGVKCPINYVKAKIKLETMDRGQTLFLYLDDGEPIRNVPSSLKNDGQEILKMEKVEEEEYYELLVKKAV
jgi:sulfite reductase (ferredoxin)